VSAHRLVCIALLLGLAARAWAIDRDEVMARARAIAQHPWRCTTANLTADCASSYSSVYVPGDYVGLPYDWGGYMTLFQFDGAIARGDGAGSYSDDGALACTAGLDCSGFVSQCWRTMHIDTELIPLFSNVVDQSELLAGDVLNKRNEHVALYSHSLAGGDPVFYEALLYNVHVNLHGGWSHVSGYTPRRYREIEGTEAGDPRGTTTHPIVIDSLPYGGSADTSESVSDLLDGCGAAPTEGQAGPEVVYQLTVTEPGDLTVAVADDPAVSVGVSLLTSTSTSDCLARDDATLTHAVDCGTYYIVVDTLSSEAEAPGLYTLTVSLAGSGSPCGAGPPGYEPGGALGEPCRHAGDDSLPFCNPNLGGVACLDDPDSGRSFCSKPCETAADCAEFAGGCCVDFSGEGEKYCLISSLCQAASDSGTHGEVGDAGPADSGGPQPVGDEGGCSCRVQGAAADRPMAGWLALLGLLASRGGRRQKAFCSLKKKLWSKPTTGAKPKP
jgi:MYXO-CTERM domain-containing protein